MKIFSTVLTFFVLILTLQAYEDMNSPEKICEPICNIIDATTGACIDWYGDAITLTSVCQNLIQNQSEAEVCDYFKPGTTTDTCFYKNGTVEINMCFSFWSMIYLLKTRCAEYYQINNTRITYLGNLQINFIYNPCVECRPSLGMQYCQMRSSPSGESCANCTT